MMPDLPDILTGSPEQEAMEAGLDHIIFDPLEKDAAQRQAGGLMTPPLRAYALLDASQSADIPICLEGFSAPARCLFDGHALDDLAEVAPWLVEMTRYSDAWDWFAEDGYGHNWGILIHSRLELPRLKTQLKRFLKIEDEDGERYFFKYYRPEHFNRYVPSFDSAQRAAFWCGIEVVYAESKDDPATLLRHAPDAQDKQGGHRIDLIKTGKPLVIKPAVEAGGLSSIPARG